MRTVMKERLWAMMCGLRKDRAMLDPEWDCLKEACEALETQFKEKHRNNRVLLAEMLDQVDTNLAFAEYRGEVQFFLGLQMGLELGELDVIEP